MRILFYLPVITPWWFDHIVAPLIRCLAGEHEVHVLAPVPWQGTGIGPRELDSVADLTEVKWHIVDGDGHPTMRTEPRDRAGIVAFARALAPDYVLCRSADCETVRAFPGVVRHMMEGGAPPLAIPADWIVLQEEPFDHGLLPPLDGDQRDVLDRLIAPLWKTLTGGVDAITPLRSWAPLPADRPLLALPLEYEHEENFFPMHRVGATPNHRLIAELAERIDDRFSVAVTNHPLNEQHIDNSALEAEIAAHPQMRLLAGASPDGESATMALARAADGMLIGDSKVYALAGFLGTPMLRQSRFRTGAWLNAYADLATFLGDVAAGTAHRPDQAAARIWFAFHVANNLLDPDDPALTASDLLARLDRPVDPARWAAGFARLDAVLAAAPQ
ncbi:hypothetical protein U1839_10870 [Sphingomonas sp. RT2P30]|uniref:hypothetical protein n=1 Tax=Parasphingomonas halimpatiens TaxID=3096162 RepID=UPI002FC671FD